MASRKALAEIDEENVNRLRTKSNANELTHSTIQGAQLSIADELRRASRSRT